MWRWCRSQGCSGGAACKPETNTLLTETCQTPQTEATGKEYRYININCKWAQLLISLVNTLERSRISPRHSGIVLICTGLHFLCICWSFLKPFKRRPNLQYRWKSRGGSNGHNDQQFEQIIKEKKKKNTNMTLNAALEFQNQWKTLSATHHWNVRIFECAINKMVSLGTVPTHTVTGKMLLAAVMVMHVLNTTCSQCPCSTQSSELQDKGSVKVMFSSSWASRPAKTRQTQSSSVHHNHRPQPRSD